MGKKWIKGHGHFEITASYSFGNSDVLHAFYKVLNVILTFEKTKAADIY